jgi:hypothetical protein
MNRKNSRLGPNFSAATVVYSGMTDSTGILGGWLNSPRKQRRLLIVSAAVFAVGVVSFVSVFVLRGTSNAYPDTISSQPAKLAPKERTVPVTKQQVTLMRTFIKTAVARKKLAFAYTLVDPDLKGTMTLAEWEKGNIPVIQYEAENIDTAEFTPVYHYQDQALFNVELIPVGHTQKRPELLFFIGMKRAGDSKTGKWLIDYWQPRWRPPVPAAPG